MKIKVPAGMIEAAGKALYGPDFGVDALTMQALEAAVGWLDDDLSKHGVPPLGYVGGGFERGYNQAFDDVRARFHAPEGFVNSWPKN